MYCKHCGQKIPDDSSFCQYCGGKVSVLMKEVSCAGGECEESNNKDSLDNTDDFIQSQHTDESKPNQESTQKVIVSTETNKPIQIEISKKKKDYSSNIANEIIANLKMVGWSFLLYFVFWIGFYISRSKDTKQISETTSFVYGRYDSYINEQYYHSTINTDEAYFQKLVILDLPGISANVLLYMSNEYEHYRKANFKEKEEIIMDYERKLKLNEEQIISLKNEAKEQVATSWKKYTRDINEHRKEAFKWEAEDVALIAGLICLAITILGRYLLLFIRWIITNKNT